MNSQAHRRQNHPSGDAPMQTRADPFSSEALFSGGGELGSLMRSTDWEKTSLGPVDKWPQNLKTCIRILLTSRQPMFVWWGDELINLYNDAYKAIVGGKHPWALGQPAKAVWSEIWDQVGPRAESALLANEGTYDEALLLIMERYGYREETYYTFSYSPVPNDQGGAGGIFCANSEDTQRIISERQLALLGDLGARTGDARTWQEACRLSALSLSTDPRDVCFSLIYILDEGRNLGLLAGSSGIPSGHEAAPSSFHLDAPFIWPIAPAIDSHEIQMVTEFTGLLGNLPEGTWGCKPNSVVVAPLVASGPASRSGAIVVGLNPYRAFDDQYRNFLKLIASQVSTSIANAEAYEQERLRAESLAALDRAKTTFFSNVSHEFRTPLTLMLGPLEDMLANRAQLPAGEIRREIEIVHRNGLRLLKLVNTLLDFSKIEAGRVQAVYRPGDLCAITMELANMFRAAIEAAGLALHVSCAPLSQSVYIDHDMWEKVVLNLLSNALKFTMTGLIEVSVRESGAFAEVSVRDTGVGIPERELPRVFERFHRIDGSRGRTHEGTGIGLALVDELVRLHGGAVEVVSRQGVGTTFTVRIPFGSAHLPANRVVEKGSHSLSTTGALPYVQEALQWLPSLDAREAALVSASANEDLSAFFEQEDTNATRDARIVLVDDNRDIREYVERLLARRYQVTTFEDGEAALEAILADPPDLVLTDVMMPRLDGFGLLSKLRRNTFTATVPVIMLSARAGEEARSEGMEAGADDYLVKPFTARELMARVGAHVAMYRLRSQLATREHELRLKAEEAERQYRMILESISEGFVFVDREGRIRYMNEQSAAIAGRATPELVGKPIFDEFPELVNSAIGAGLTKSLQTNEIQSVEDFYPPLNRWLSTKMYPSAQGVSIFVQDVSERRKQQEQLLLTEKLAATGRLAATIAHEINNPLEAVLNLLYLARISTNAPHQRINEYLLTAEQELTRVAQIARHTLGFYRQTAIPVSVDLARVLEEVLNVYHSRLQASAVVVTKRFESVPALHALRGEIHQVFSNLISNAIDAMPTGGELVLCIASVQKSGRSGIEITVEDTGAGIPEHHRHKLFEAFFTTKASVGTGLGLWVVKQFIEEHGGQIWVNSSTDAINHGTQFTIFLPQAAMIQPTSRVM